MTSPGPASEQAGSSAGRPTELAAVLAEFRESAGLDFRQVELVLARLSGPDPVDLSGLVRGTAVPRGTVEQLLRRLDPWLRRDGALLRLEAPPPVPPPARVDVTSAVPVDPALVATMRELAAALPPSLRRLDHVPATPETMAARAAYLRSEYALDGRTVLCLGDHDLTSLAVGSSCPDTELLVVDVDELLLEFLARTADRLGLRITTAYGDLRAGLPTSLHGRADLVFTDPPYTPAGIRLFLHRGLQALRRDGHGRLAMAYGFAGSQLGRGFQTQSTATDLRLVVEALLPRFNRFDGAEAIGAAADLYVFRPTSWTWPMVDRGAADEVRIYTRGVAAEEAAPPRLGAVTVAAVRRALGDAEPGDVELLGEGWPPEPPLDGRPTPWSRFLAAATTPAPPGRPAPRPVVAAAMLPDLGGLAVRVLLAAARRELAVLAVPMAAAQAPGLDDPASPVRALLAAALDVGVDRAPSSEGVLVLAARPAGRPAAPDPAADLTREILLRPAMTLGNAWRDGLLALARRAGGQLTRNQARALARESGVRPAALGLRTVELPLADLRELAAAVARSAAAASAVWSAPA